MIVNKVVNKIVSRNAIIAVADYLERYKEKYKGSKITYSLYFHDGRLPRETEYNEFRSELNRPKDIQAIGIYLQAQFPYENNKLLVSNRDKKIEVEVIFEENNAEIHVDGDVTEKEINLVFGEIRDILEDGVPRYDKTIKNRWLRVEIFSLAIGTILFYLAYIIFVVNRESLSNVAPLLMTPNTFILMEIVLTVVLGNLIGIWIVFLVYKPLLKTAIKKTDRKKYFSKEEEFKAYSEVAIGAYYNCVEKRSLIELIFKISIVILIAQVIISIILYTTL